MYAQELRTWEKFCNVRSMEHAQWLKELTQGEVNVHISNDPELLVAYLFDNHPELEASVVGENWVYECSPPLGASDCPGLAELFGGESIER